MVIDRVLERLHVAVPISDLLDLLDPNCQQFGVHVHLPDRSCSNDDLQMIPCLFGHASFGSVANLGGGPEPRGAMPCRMSPHPEKSTDWVLSPCTIRLVLFT